MIAGDGTVRLAYDVESTVARYGVDQFREALTARGGRLETVPIRSAEVPGESRTVCLVDPGDSDHVLDVDGVLGATDVPAVEPEGYVIQPGIGDSGEGLLVVGGDDRGLLYGLLAVVERLEAGVPFRELPAETAAPTVSLRAIKFNLPWHAYREGPQTDVHLETCRDTAFWERFLDMMVRNRFNALTLWNLHPFSYMVRLDAYPEACSLDETEFAEWQAFWNEFFAMAARRDIDVYVVNWNAIVSPEFERAHRDLPESEYETLVRDYTKASVEAVIDEYDGLTGLGVTLSNDYLYTPEVCMWFREYSPRERREWLEETFLAGIAASDREVDFVYRSTLSESLEEVRRGIDAAAAIDTVGDIHVPVKFNWSHGHSSTDLRLTHDYPDGSLDDRLWNPEPETYDIAWTVRNEDFFVLRWGNPDFVRAHIEANARGAEYVSGYVIGSEGFVPAKDISHSVHRHQTWQYIFEKQWLFYMLWGRLLYDPGTPDAVFERAFESRYQPGVGPRMLEGFAAGSRMPLEFASFHAGTWDYSLYSEGFLAIEETLGMDDGHSPFVSVDELIEHTPLASSYVSIPDYVESGNSDLEPDAVSPLELADSLEESAETTAAVVESVRADLYEFPRTLECEILDLEAWAALSRYFASKLRGAVALHAHRVRGEPDRKAAAIRHLETAADHWNRVVAITDSHYREHPYAGDWKDDIAESVNHDREENELKESEKRTGAPPGEFPYPPDYREEPTFHWRKYADQVERDVQIARDATPE